MTTRYRIAPLAVTFSSLLDCGEPDLKAREIALQIGSRLAWLSSTQETGSMVDLEVNWQSA